MIESIHKEDEAEIPSLVYKYAQPAAIDYILATRQIQFSSSSGPNDINENLWNSQEELTNQSRIAQANAPQQWLSNKSIKRPKRESEELLGGGQFSGFSRKPISKSALTECPSLAPTARPYP